MLHPKSIISKTIDSSKGTLAFKKDTPETSTWAPIKKTCMMLKKSHQSKLTKGMTDLCLGQRIG